MNALIFFCLSDIFLNIPKTALAFNNSEDSYSEDLTEAEGNEFSSAETPGIFPGLIPEVVRYAKHRCSHDLPRANVNWGAQIFSNEAEAHDTHCYVKCFLRRVGLIRLKKLGWDVSM